jgi:hypothetical protein
LCRGPVAVACRDPRRRPRGLCTQPRSWWGGRRRRWSQQICLIWRGPRAAEVANSEGHLAFRHHATRLALGHLSAIMRPEPPPRHSVSWPTHTSCVMACVCNMHAFANTSLCASWSPQPAQPAEVRQGAHARAYIRLRPARPEDRNVHCAPGGPARDRNCAATRKAGAARNGHRSAEPWRAIAMARDFLVPICGGQTRAARLRPLAHQVPLPWRHQGTCGPRMPLPSAPPAPPSP